MAKIPSFGASMIMHQTLPDISRIHVGIACHPWWFACFTTVSVKASFFGVHPSEYKNIRQTKKTHTSSDIHPCMCDFSSVHTDRLDGTFFFVSDRSKSLSVTTKIPPDVCLQALLPALSSVCLAVSAANLHPCFTLLILCSV